MAVKIIGVFVKLFFLLTPFFVLSMYVMLTQNEKHAARQSLAIRSTIAVLVIVMVLYWFGDAIFRSLGITLDAFRIGSGLVLLLNGIDVVRGTGISNGRQSNEDGDVAVVPLAIPYAVGPGTVGALLLMGAEAQSVGTKVIESIGIILAVGVLGLLMFYSDTLEKFLKRKGMNILSKLTGLYLAALASQIIFAGVKSIMQGGT